MVEPPSGPLALSPGWDPRDPWTLRFVEAALERACHGAMSAPGTQRIRIAHAVGAPIWLALGIMGPLLGIPAFPAYAACGINVVWDSSVAAFLTFRRISLARVWALAFFTTTFGALCLVYAFGTGVTFLTVGVGALMTNAAFGIALVRPAGWVAAAVSVMTFLVFLVVVLLFDVGGLGAYEAVLLAALLTGATLGARFLEGAERTAFAQGFLIRAHRPAFRHRLGRPCSPCDRLSVSQQINRSRAAVTRR